MRTRTMLAAILVAAVSTVTNSAETATENAPEKLNDAAPRTYDNRLIVFPDDPMPEVGPEQRVLRVEEEFSDERAAQSLEFCRSLYHAQDRMQEAFYQNSNLGSFSESGNPYVYQTPRQVAKMPDDAVIEWKLTKDEFAELDLPAWEMIVMGGNNHFAYLSAWREYTRYNTARLELALMDCRREQDSKRRSALETQLRQAKQVVIEYLQTPPAD